MTELFLNGLILLMIGANFICLRIIVGPWAMSVLPENRTSRYGIDLAMFLAAVSLTLWALTNYLSHSAWGHL